MGSKRSRQEIALDLVLIPYYGDEATAGVYRSKADRIMNQTRARTTSRNASMGLLLVAVAFLVQNIWIWYKRTVLLASRRNRYRERILTLNIFAHSLGPAEEKIYVTVNSIKL